MDVELKLAEAINNFDPEAVKAALGAGANPNLPVTDAQWGASSPALTRLFFSGRTGAITSGQRTPFQEAETQKFNDILDALLGHGAMTDQNAVVTFRWVDSASLLKLAAAGLDVKNPYKRGIVPLIQAWETRPDLLPALQQAGASFADIHNGRPNFQVCLEKLAQKDLTSLNFQEFRKFSTENEVPFSAGWLYQNLKRYTQVRDLAELETFKNCIHIVELPRYIKESLLDWLMSIGQGA